MSAKQSRVHELARPVHLSKSRIALALQCPKRLHFKVHHPEAEEIDAQSKVAFATGDEVGELARELYTTADSIYIDVPYDELDRAVVETDELIRSGHRAPIFEATFRNDDVVVRVDALLPDGDGWRIVEVKSSTSVDGSHIPDCAIQAWVCRGAGLDIRRIAVAHIDNTFIYRGNGDYRGLLIEEDVTDAVQEQLDHVADWVDFSNVPLRAPCARQGRNPDGAGWRHDQNSDRHHRSNR